MRNIPKLIVLLILIYSCTPSSKLITVSSTNVPLQNSKFVFENDTLRISYNFWAENGIMSFDIYNKTSYPIYFDWKNSSFIPNSQMVSYWQDVTNTSSDAISSWISGSKFGRSVSKSVRQERIGVIPPHAQITRSDFRLIKNKDLIPKPGDYSEKQSFLDFRNYLTFSANEKFEGKVSTVDNEFYASSIKTVKYKDKDRYNSPNMFFIKVENQQPQRQGRGHYSNKK